MVVQASQAGSSSFGAATPVKKTITVNRALLTLTAKSISVPVGKAIPALTCTLSGLVNRGPATVVNGKPAETTTARKGSPVGRYTIALAKGTLEAANYTLAFVDGRLTITSLGTAKAPMFMPAAGTYKKSASVTITDATPGAVIHYTTNGRMPTAMARPRSKSMPITLKYSGETTLNPASNGEPSAGAATPSMVSVSVSPLK